MNGANVGILFSYSKMNKSLIFFFLGEYEFDL